MFSNSSFDKGLDEYNPDLIAGLIIQIGSIMIDTSIRTKLKKLEKNMIEA